MKTIDIFFKICNDPKNYLDERHWCDKDKDVRDLWLAIYNSEKYLDEKDTDKYDALYCFNKIMKPQLNLTKICYENSKSFFTAKSSKTSGDDIYYCFPDKNDALKFNIIVGESDYNIFKKNQSRMVL